ncbi:hypothetical protein TWF594_003632 [Orbilia oligospora]|uniref:Uncharacterized protein n=1 Tax=Orbilia oligospora TaxID=2813651 RepID=A0A7C8JT01_ORBOL|nr:hypothetical protein TWF703_004887 [Orbilia oligospora]KAF3146317.1 hypothetical protein TWF594_003632 [Orbilia oligospora]
MASEPTTLPTNQPAPPTASTEGTAQETPNRPRNKRLPGIPRKFYVTIRNLGLIFFVAFPMAHMASWALTIWMLGRGADKLAASLDTTKPFDETVFRNTLRHVVTVGARGWRINVIMLSLAHNKNRMIAPSPYCTAPESIRIRRFQRRVTVAPPDDHPNHLIGVGTLSPKMQSGYGRHRHKGPDSA